MVVYLMVSNATFNNISAILWRPVLLVEETGVSGENHRHVACHWPTLFVKVVLSTPRFELTTLLEIGTDCKLKYDYLHGYLYFCIFLCNRQSQFVGRRVLRYYSIFSFICMVCRSLFVLSYFLFLPLCCLFFFDIRILIICSINSSHQIPLILISY
jgi:hypothetical protein